LAERLEIERPHAFGLAVSVWCLCWREQFLDGRLKRWTAQALADEILWKGDSKKLVESMVAAEILVREGDGTLVAKNFTERQGPLINKLLSDRKTAEDKAKAAATKLNPPAPTSDRVVLHILDQMKLCKITGSVKQKREEIEAWRARGIKGDEILAAIMNNSGLDIWELKKIVIGKAPASPAQAGNDSVSKIRKQFLGEAK